MGNITFDLNTDVGNKRSVNEDSIWPPPGTMQHPYGQNAHGMLFVVADGMGGHGAGDVASKIAVDIIPQIYYDPGNSETDVAIRLDQAIRAAHQAIAEVSTTATETERMGTTVVAIVLKKENKKLWVGWVGDSRAYRLRNGQLEQLTEDHSVLWPQIKAGDISWEALHYHPQRSKLSNSLSAHREEVKVSLDAFELQDDDQILLCSDGLTSEVREERIGQILASQSPQKSARLLIQAAKEKKVWLKEGKKVQSRGGEDNISTVVIHMPEVKLKAAPVAGPALAWLVGAAAAAVIVLILLGLAAFMLFRPGSEESSSAAAVASPAANETPQSGEVILGESQVTPTATLAPGETRPPTATLAPGETRAPTSTLAPVAATPTPPSQPGIASTVENPTPPPPQPGSLDGEILLVKPNPDYGLPYGVKSITFEWRWKGGCHRPPEGHGFELRVWRPDVGPMGAMDAKAQQGEIKCQDGNWIYEVGNFEAVPGAAGTLSGKFNWDVIIVQIEPDYNGHPLAEAKESPQSFVIAGEGGGSGGDGGGSAQER